VCISGFWDSDRQTLRVEIMTDENELHRHIQAARSGDAASRRRAIHTLSQLEEQRWSGAASEEIHPLVESLQQQLLEATNQRVLRQELVVLLGNLGTHSKPAIPQLIELLQDGIPDRIRAEAATALGKIGKEARNHADQRVQAALVALWLSPDHTKELHVRVAYSLCRLKIDATGLPSFLTSTLVADQNFALRLSAAEILAWCSKNEVDVVPALLTAALTDKCEEVSQRAETSLNELHLSRGQSILLCARQLGSSLYAETALRNSGEPAVSSLVEALRKGDLQTREKALRILGNLGELAQAATQEVTKALHDKNHDIRLAAAKALWNITKNAEGVVPSLVDLLKGKLALDQGADEARRRFLQTVIEALRRIGPPAQDAIPALIEKTKDKNRPVRESALGALKHIAPTLPNGAPLR
jgi:HEAT repeat protein